MIEAAVLRQGVARLSSTAGRDATRVLRAVAISQAREVLSDILPPLIDQYGSAAATFAAEWYNQRRAATEVRGRYRATPVSLGRTGAESLAGWAIDPLFAEAPNLAAAQVKLVGGLQRRIANAARDTIMQNSTADPQARGWQRDGVGECSFCQMLIGRGAVYTQASANFLSHDHCNCCAVPAY